MDGCYSGRTAQMVAEIAMILALKDYDACYAALKKTRQVVTVLEAAREDAQLGF